MKICKVKLEKVYIEHADGSTRCDSVYPDGYDPKKIKVIAYDEKPLNRGKNAGYCIGWVANDFQFTDDMVEITRPIAKAFAIKRAQAEKDAIEAAKYQASLEREIDNG